MKVRLSATDRLRYRRSEVLGDMIVLELKLAVHLPVWWRWTVMLNVAMLFERGVL